MIDGTDVKVLYGILPFLSASKVKRLARYLEPDELDRACRFVVEKDRHLFIASRALLRHSLCSFTGSHHWHLQAGPYGKPELRAMAGERPVQFNLSHTAGLVICAVSRLHAVGVDAEVTDRALDFSSISERYFSLSERRYLALCPCVRRSEAFFRIWTFKEAVAKAIDQGLSISLADIVITLEPLSISFAPRLRQDVEMWHIEEFKPTATHQAALAVRRPAGLHLTVRWQLSDIESL